MLRKLVMLVAGLVLVSATAVWASPASNEGGDKATVAFGSQTLSVLNLSAAIQYNPLTSTDAHDGVQDH